MKNGYVRQHPPKIVSYPPRLAGLQIASREGVLWPFQAFKVSIPSRRGRALNIFEDTILRLSVIGLYTPGELSEITCMKVEIVEFIQNKLRNLGFLTDRNEATDAARKLAQGMDADPDEYVAATVFVDLIGGKVFPILLESPLEFLGIAGTDRDTVSFYRGTTGKRSVVSAVMMDPLGGWIRKRPSPADVTQAASAHQRLIKRYASLERSGAMRSEFGRLEDTVTVADSGETIFLYCESLVQQGSEDFVVTDPFGFGVSSHLTGKLKELLKKQRQAEYVVERLLRRAQRDRVGGDEERQEERDIFENFRVYPEVKYRLQRSWRDLQDAKELVTSDAEEKWVQRKVNDLMGNLYACLEWGLRQVVFEYPVEEWVFVYGSQTVQENEKTLRTFAEKCRLQVPEHAALLQVSPGKMKAYAGGEVEMQPLLALALAGASQFAGHPLHAVVRHYPDWLAYINRLKSLRDAVLHGEDVTPSKLYDYWRTCYRSVCLLFPAIPAGAGMEGMGSMAGMDGTDGPAWGAEPAARDDSYAQLRIRARIRLDDVLGIDKVVGLPDNLREQLMNVEMFLEESRSEQQAFDCSQAVNDLANALQGALFRLARAHRERSRSQKADRIEQAARRAVEAGFLLENGALPYGIRRVNPHRLERAIRGTNATLGANLLAFLLLMPPENLSEIAEGAPDLIEAAGQVAKLRGHGNTAVYLSPERIEKLKQQVFQSIKLLTEV
ncbi:hypothetical protein [Paenibacillus sabinae]|uniref:Uncharacterized protein n=1 Tax=Paenibacillus sabinae T27 TaxID=1268072 RepID=X4ZFU5_9BACL|nr:hypothetical protein [Paenibacillus sabinae]AHV95635.1 hypothetical protein PSAB_03495 [Paenibacillus sabinae T27]